MFCISNVTQTMTQMALQSFVTFFFLFVHIGNLVVG